MKKKYTFCEYSSLIPLVEYYDVCILHGYCIRLMRYITDCFIIEMEITKDRRTCNI